jgi:glutamine amidotransferase
MTAMDTVIIDYGMGNLRSVQRGLEKAGTEAVISGDPDRVGRADKLVLPGVGAFRDAVARLRGTGLDQPIIDHVRADRPFLGICLGLQLLFTTSHEDGAHAGLDLFPGEVVRFAPSPDRKVPHMGWNRVRPRGESVLFRDLPDPAWVYFVHSYHVVPRDPEVIALECDYGGPFPAAVTRGRIFATQFHPEKSQHVGRSILHKFVTLC